MVAGLLGVVLQLQSYPSQPSQPSAQLTTSYAYIDPSLATSQPLQPPPALTSVSSASSRLREAQSGQEEFQRSKVPVPAVCLVVDAGRFNDRAEGSWPDQQPQVGSIMFLLFTITLSFTDQTCCYCSHIRAIISLKLI